MDPKEIRSEDVNWINLASDKIYWWDALNMAMKFMVLLHGTHEV
jgi:hypothetical protein